MSSSTPLPTTPDTRSHPRFARKHGSGVKRDTFGGGQLSPSHDEAHLLLNLQAGSPPTASRANMSIHSIVNEQNVPITTPTTSHTALATPASAPPHGNRCSGPPSSPLVLHLRARSASVPRTNQALNPSIWDDATGRRSRSGTRSMSISDESTLHAELQPPVEPEAVSTPPKQTPARKPASPSKSKAFKLGLKITPKPSNKKVTPFTVETIPEVLPKARGRVTKGPKKRHGPGWIIESCTTSGVASDDESKGAAGGSTSPRHAVSAPDLISKLDALDHDVFGGDSDLTDVDSDSDEEYDPGLAGMPPLPQSSDSEYAPHLASGRRSRRIYPDIQSSARTSVRLVSRTARSPSKSDDESNHSMIPQRRSRWVHEASSIDDTDANNSDNSTQPPPRGARTVILAAEKQRRKSEADKPARASQVRNVRRKSEADKPTRVAPRRLRARAKQAESDVDELQSSTDDDVHLWRGSRLQKAAAARSEALKQSGSTVRLSRKSESPSRLPPPPESPQRTQASQSTGYRNVLTEPLSSPSSVSLGKYNPDFLGPRLQARARTHIGEGSLLPNREFPVSRLAWSPSLGESRVASSISIDGTQSEVDITQASESAAETHVSATTTDGDDDEPLVKPRKLIARDYGHNGPGSFKFAKNRSPSKRVSPSVGRQIVEVVLPTSKRSRTTAGQLIPTSLRGSPGQQLYVLVSSPTYHRRSLEHEPSGSEPNRRRAPQAEWAIEPPAKKSRVEHAQSSSQAKGKSKATASDADVQVSESSGRRPRRQSKPTTRAVESAEQERSWGDDGPRIWIEYPSRKRAESSVPPGATDRVVNVSRGTSASRSTRSDGKRRRDQSEAPSASKRAKTGGDTEAPLVRLREGDFVLRQQTKRCFYYTMFEQTIVPRCLACRKKKAGDTCRFVGIRYLKLTPGSMDAIGVSFDTGKAKEQPEYHLPTHWNVVPVIEQVNRIRDSIARALHPVLSQELDHALKPNAIWRPVELEVRATCDVCATSVFSSCYMCTHCGRELCGDCYQHVEEMCPVGTPTIYKGPGRKNPQLLRYRTCAGNDTFHTPNNFRPITRFTREELEGSVKEMKSAVNDSTPTHLFAHSGSSQITKWAARVPAWIPASPEAPTEPPALSDTGSSHGVSSLRETPDLQHASMPIIASPTMSPTHEDRFGPTVGIEPSKRFVASHHGYTDIANLPSHQVHFFDNEITEDQFKPLWARGEAVVVQGLLESFKIQWTPKYFIEQYGAQDCSVVNCNNNEARRSTVEGFFTMFSQKDRPDEVLKLKDWPSQADFRDDFPELFEDFMGALPIPNYTRRDGILNVASHFATNAIAPDLGPKMYNAFASNEGPGGQGSTRLHMDMADAVNIMMFANDSKQGLPGVAVWDIFRACDSDKIRSYLRRHFDNQKIRYQDPIHSQLFYLDSDHRRRLYEEEGVYSWRIYQRPGEAVFIPAGCAHQVCNLADCIKVAIDFVSLENINRCEKLTAEFRNENDVYTWKEDVLQLRTMMMYAWRSADHLRKAWEEHGRGADSG